MKQTAVEFLEKLWKQEILFPYSFDLAKQMEKEQILQSHIDGQPLYSCQSEKAEQYYNDTYKK